MQQSNKWDGAFRLVFYPTVIRIRKIWLIPSTILYNDRGAISREFLFPTVSKFRCEIEKKKKGKEKEYKFVDVYFETRETFYHRAI